MKKGRVCLAVLGCAVAAFAATNDVTVVVTGDRVSLRAEPDLNAVLLDRAMSGDELVLKDNDHAEWVGVLPPPSVDLWVLGKYVESDTVVPPKLNVRSGPSLSHSVVGVVTNGTELRVRGELAGWLKSAPPQAATVWISRRFVEAVSPPTEPETTVEVVPAPEPKPTDPSNVVIIETEQQKEASRMMAAGSDVPELPEVLISDPGCVQGTSETLSGILQFAGGILYKLVDPTADNAVVCYVRGNADQLALLKGRLLIVTGPVYRAQNLKMPFVRPVEIKLLKEPRVSR